MEPLHECNIAANAETDFISNFVSFIRLSFVHFAAWIYFVVFVVSLFRRPWVPVHLTDAKCIRTPPPRAILLFAHRFDHRPHSCNISYDLTLNHGDDILKIIAHVFNSCRITSKTAVQILEISAFYSHRFNLWAANSTIEHYTLWPTMCSHLASCPRVSGRSSSNAHNTHSERANQAAVAYRIPFKPNFLELSQRSRSLRFDYRRAFNSSFWSTVESIRNDCADCRRQELKQIYT